MARRNNNIPQTGGSRPTSRPSSGVDQHGRNDSKWEGTADGVGNGTIGKGANIPFPITGGAFGVGDFGANGKDAGWLDVLNHNSLNSFSDLLAGLGIDKGGAVDSSAAQDWNKQLAEAILNYYLTINERSYNEKLLKDQRIYDSPTNMLARLMGAGISRDAAIQMLSGSGGSSSAIGSSGSISAPSGIAPSESEKNAMETKLAPVHTAFEAISTVGSLVSLGFTVPQSIAQTKFLTAQGSLLSSQVKGFQLAGKAFNILHSAGSAAESFASAGSAIAELQRLAEGGNTDAAQFLASPDFTDFKNNAPFVSQSLRDLGISERGYSDYSTQFGKFVEQTNADIAWKKTDQQRVAQQILNLQEELEFIASQTDFVEGQTDLLEYHKKQVNAQVDLLRKQGKNVEADSLLKQKQTTILDYQNQYTESLYNDTVNGKSGLSIITHREAVQAYNDMQKFVAAKDYVDNKGRHIWDQELQYLSMDYKRLYNIALLQTSYSKGAFDKYSSDPDYADLLNACSGFEQCGAWNYIDSKIRSNTIATEWGAQTFFNDSDVDKALHIK